MDDDLVLLTPGPVTVDEAILGVLAQPMTTSYGSKWLPFNDALAADLKTVFQTGNDLYTVTGPGTASLEMGLCSVADAGETVIVVNNGFFGNRLCEIAQAYGMNLVEIKVPVDQRVGVEQIGPVLDAYPGAVAVALVHHDTTTGVQNDAAAIARLAHERGAVCVVDAVSSLGGIDVPVDEWGLDICVTIPNKCLGAVPGLAAISVSPRAWEVIDSKETRGWYLNLRTWRWYAANWAAWHPAPTTVAVSAARALSASLKAILDEGLHNVFERHQTVAATVRRGLRELGFEMVLPEEESSPVLTTVRSLPGMDVPAFAKWLLNERGLMISGALGDLAGKAFRVGHMGRAAHLDIAERFLAAVEEYLAQQA